MGILSDEVVAEAGATAIGSAAEGVANLPYRQDESSTITAVKTAQNVWAMLESTLKAYSDAVDTDVTNICKLGDEWAEQDQEIARIFTSEA